MVDITPFFVAGLVTVAIPALAQPQAAVFPSTTSVPCPIATKHPRIIAVELFGRLFAAPTAAKRFQACQG
jgi:hypothetical protein